MKILLARRNDGSMYVYVVVVEVPRHGKKKNISNYAKTNAQISFAVLILIHG